MADGGGVGAVVVVVVDGGDRGGENILDWMGWGELALFDMYRMAALRFCDVGRKDSLDGVLCCGEKTARVRV